MSKKILTVFGTRPEAIKMAPVINALNEEKSTFSCKVCITGQHREMLAPLLSFFKIQPNYHLDLMEKNQSLSKITQNVLAQMQNILASEKPDLVLVHGDTTTALSSAMAAFYNNIAIGHVEAGLRTFQINSPYPEEFNRQVISKISCLHFAPTEGAKENLTREGVSEERIYVTGNTVIDSLLATLQTIEDNPMLMRDIIYQINEMLPFNWQDNKFVLITAHRRENFGSGFIKICKAIKTMALENNDKFFVYPVHLNPLVQGVVFEQLSGLKNVFLIPPVNYQSFILLLSKCYFVLTDSGGIQEEAPSLGKPVLVMRETTERPEAVKSGSVRLVGTNINDITSNIRSLFIDTDLYLKMSNAINPYGDGTSSTKIKNILKEVNFAK
jgi:UDP-N-acetylglucosamine 2-epimerase (non-hydrolysing)